MDELCDLPGEIWKDIAGYEGLYQVSNMGRVKSLERTRNMNNPNAKSPAFAPVNERILTFGKSLGYRRVILAKDGVNRGFRVHKLVALAFIPNPENKTQINHKDGDKHNNRAENLEWVTPSENQQHALKTGLRNGLKWRKTVNQYSLDGTFIRSWAGYVEINETLGFAKQAICHCCKGRCPTAYGYIWRLANG